ncbi:MAG: universal stress protein, partial [Actinomycetota bacterium]|nr:universal stress protein [Actinomycetota bacterium]
GHMFTSIVWAADDSEHAKEALPHVMKLAHEGATEITILHVVERVEGGGAVGPTRRVDEGKIQDELERLAKDLSSGGIKASVVVRSDVGVRPAHEIVDLAGKKSADLIVVGTRGRSLLSEILLGSETLRLLHLAPCPVLVVPTKM